MPDLDRPRLALYVALGLAICVLGARYVLAQASPSPASGGGAAVTPRGGEEGGGGAVRVERANGGKVTVHVAGAVRRPGVYRLPADARVNDALRRAGGARGRADLAAVNLAAKLEDGRQVLVPERATRAAAATGGAAGASAAATGATAPGAPINLNTATLEQLDELDGIGPTTAQHILDYRTEHNGFGSVDELDQVPGIGETRMAALRDKVRV